MNKNYISFITSTLCEICGFICYYTDWYGKINSEFPIDLHSKDRQVGGKSQEFNYIEVQKRAQTEKDSILKFRDGIFTKKDFCRIDSDLISPNALQQLEFQIFRYFIQIRYEHVGQGHTDPLLAALETYLVLS